MAESKGKKEIRLNEMMSDYPNIPYSKLGTITAPCLIMGGAWEQQERYLSIK